MNRYKSYVPPPACTRPCDNCPFKRGTTRKVGRKKINEILTAESLVCLNTLDGHEKDWLQCAGHMIMFGFENKFYRFLRKCKWKINLRGQDEIFTSVEKCHDYHCEEAH